ncbi:unnamed protein product [Medioppia subpectinata]|uniref:Uncharacterized protein n=1 Tax=Medioppia subpectinata TaxID=1979941 RepID=A0A7R9L6Y1_9ACAR|nr:unnamed protein product [Medioppia subpectinata]CAG2116469.1 unnamed protein product [Medioppia subpectinata]
MRQLTYQLIKRHVNHVFNTTTYPRLTPISAAIVNKAYKSSVSTPIKSVDRLVVNKNMTLRYCHPMPVSDETADNAKKASDGRRPLVVFFAWMLAKDQHIEKYRNLYFKRGFDVLTVKTSPLELIFPTRGSQKVAENVMNFMHEKRSDYPSVVVHAFSVGAYQFGEVLVHLQRNGTVLADLAHTVKGVIVDSVADMNVIPVGLSRAVTKNSALRAVFKAMISTHMKLFYSIATKHYAASSEAYKNNVFRCPSLIICSKRDIVGNAEDNRKVMDRWRENNIEVQWKCFENSTHVGHLHKYPEEYKHEIDSFLKKINL